MRKRSSKTLNIDLVISLNMKFPEPTVDINEIKKKYHAIVEEEKKEKEEQTGGKKGKKGKKSRAAWQKPGDVWAGVCRHWRLAPGRRGQSMGQVVAPVPQSRWVRQRGT